MAKFTIDGTEYDSNDLSDSAKNQLSGLQFVQREINRLEAQIAVFKTAASAYTQALKDEVPN